MASITEITQIPENERVGCLCAHFPSAGSTSRCNRQAVWLEYSIHEVSVIRARAITKGTYEVRLFYCERHKPGEK